MDAHTDLPVTAAPGAGVSSRLKTYALIMLVTANIFATVDRQLVSILTQSIKNALHVSDFFMGLLNGLYFSIFLILTSIPMAIVADRGNRRAIVAACVAVWSVATMACGLAQSYVQLAMGRMVVAVGEGGSSPAAMSILADMFPLRMRSLVLGLFSGGGAIGMGLGLFLGGTLNDLLGWRNVFLVVGAPGALFALALLLTVKEPSRPVHHSVERPSVLRVLGQLFRIPTYWLVLFINLVAGTTIFSFLAWTPAFLIRIHHMSTSQIGVEVGLASVLGLFLGNISGGFCVDRLVKRSPNFLILVPSLALLTLPAFGLLVAMQQSATLSIVGYGLFMYFNSFIPPCTASSAVAVVDSRSRAVALAILGIPFTIGSALGPGFVGFMNDFLSKTHGVEAIRYSMAGISFFALVGALGGVVFARLMSKDYKSNQG